MYHLMPGERGSVLEGVTEKAEPKYQPMGEEWGQIFEGVA
jgi:hypothetical protein